MNLTGELAELFRNVSTPTDSMLVSGFHTTDVIEFRINERRNFGEALRNRPMTFPRIETFHYFLVRNIDTDLIRSHADFHKMRRLEANLWNRYLPALGDKSAQNWIIYHWRSDGNAEDFVALAIFSKPKFHVSIYVLGILIIGAAGASVQAAYTFAVKQAFSPSEDKWYFQVFFLLVCLLFIFLLYTRFGIKRTNFKKHLQRLQLGKSDRQAAKEKL